MVELFQAVLWDLDGVLVDTGQMHLQAFQETLPRFDIPITPEDFKAVFGMGNRELLTYLNGAPLDEALSAQISEEKEILFRQLIRGQAKLLPGVLELLDGMKSSHVLQAIASSAPQENIDAIVDELGIRAYFDAILSAPASGLPAKPEPHVFLEAARLLGVEPAACIVIEDSPAGVEAAKKAGMTCIAVTNTNPREQLLQADHIVDSLLEL